MDRITQKGGLFRPESPWLPSTRKINRPVEPVELTSVVSAPKDGIPVQPPEEGSRGSEPPEGGSQPPEDGSRADTPPASGPEVVLAALQNSVSVRGLVASWKVDPEETPTLKNLSFEVTKVGRKSCMS